MVQSIPPPEPHGLLPHFFACLPAALASTQPPPALLPLLSPIMRQRVQLLSPGSNSRDESWLKLLCWDKSQGEKLQSIVEAGSWEPHPASGEIEVEGVGTILYKRLDEETLRAQIPIPDYNLTVIYLWCESDQEGSGWRVAELVPYDLEMQRDTSWSLSISDANASSSKRISGDTTLGDTENPPNGQSAAKVASESDEDDDEDYWARYDHTPAGRTPATKRSPAPPSIATRPTNTDDDYYSQYADVQPALDATDPAEEEAVHNELNGQSTLNGDAFSYLLKKQDNPESSQSALHEQLGIHEDDDAVLISQPQPSRSPSASVKSDTVARLEESAALQSGSEVAVRQHISTSIKSMYRLAKSSGMDREEFKTLVQRELQVLELLD